MIYHQNIVAQKSDLVTPWRDLQWWFHFLVMTSPTSLLSLIPCSSMLVYLHAFDVVAFWVPSWRNWHLKIFQLSHLSNLQQQHAETSWVEAMQTTTLGLAGLTSWAEVWQQYGWNFEAVTTEIDSFVEHNWHNQPCWMTFAQGFRWTEVVRLRRCPWMAGRGTSQGD